MCVIHAHMHACISIHVVCASAHRCVCGVCACMLVCTSVVRAGALLRAYRRKHAQGCGQLG